MVSPRNGPDDAARPIRLLIATSNAHKLGEIARLLEESALTDVVAIGSDILPPGDPPVEDGATFEANATIKAVGFAKRAAQLPPSARPDWILADDSGLCVKALDGAPGVHSARYAGDDAVDADNNAKLLAALDGETERGAEFVCVLACGRIPPAGRPRDAAAAFEVAFTVEGRCAGRIAETPYGGGGFGYDPVFFVPSEAATFAQLPPDRKNELSHRGNALRAFCKRFRDALGTPPSVA